MSGNSFTFKQFTIKQSMSAMKIGTDSVLLGAIANFPKDGTILDIGTGTGILAIMAAQKADNALITGVEINGDAFADAVANAEATRWKERIRMVNGDIKAFEPGHKFDFIISNPPYYEKLKMTDDEGKNMARHDITLSYADLMSSANRLLEDDGRCMVIVPTDFEDNIVSEASNKGLYLTRKVSIITKAGKQAKRTIIELRRTVGSILSEEITIRDNNGEYTEGYKELTKDFYLKLN